MGSRLQRSIAVCAVTLAAILGLLWIGFHVAPNYLLAQSDSSLSEPQKAAMAIAFAAAGVLAAALFSAVREQIDHAARDVYGVIATPACRILIFGAPGSGKTTFIRRVVALRQSPTEPSTTKTSIYRLVAPLDLGSKGYIKVDILDYRGEHPSDLFLEGPVGFFGFKGARRVNVILFMVDTFPAFHDEKTGKPLTDEEVIAKQGARAQEIIESRIRQIERYITPSTIQTVFSLSFHEHRTFAVRLVVNKIDFLERLAQAGHVDLRGRTPEEFSRGLFESVRTDIENACKQNDIVDLFDVRVLSAKQRTGLDELVTSLFDLYQRRPT